MAIDVCFNVVNDESKKIKGFLPEKTEELATGYDVRNAGPTIELYPFGKALIPLGFRAIIPEGWWFKLAPRSSSFHKKSLHYLYGTVDESYENQWYFACQYIPEVDGFFDTRDLPLKWFAPYFKTVPILKIEHGERIAQIILAPRYDFNVQEVSDIQFDEMVKMRDAGQPWEMAKRGLGGFGSTGDK